MMRRWKEVENVVRCPVVTDGSTGEQWLVRLRAKGFLLSEEASEMVRSIRPTMGEQRTVTILKAESFSQHDRVTAVIRARAVEMGLRAPEPEVACLLREYISDHDLIQMGLVQHVVVMSEQPTLLYISRAGYGNRLDTTSSSEQWNIHCGFAFV